MPYFYNNLTQESVWEPPSDLTEAEILALPGASHLGLGGKPTKEVRASHILVKHSGSRRPSSWKEASTSPIYPLPRAFFSPHFLSIIYHSLTTFLGGPPPPLLFFSVFFRTAEYHTLQRGSDRDLAGIPDGDRGERGNVWQARAQALGLLFARPRWRFGPVRVWADAEAVRGCRVWVACWGDQWDRRDAERGAPHPANRMIPGGREEEEYQCVGRCERASYDMWP